ncbi:hypothetical protein CEXT_597921 [Caerostris extrusa]|uniref:Uncharacterized protein n=1 Tax=Caerostris extrusa TaxID=172846 RepID=A0AAV4UC80_CAEEX|nr:hypothetical protein CEXT_597921 [Caerostris extrusa]
MEGLGVRCPFEVRIERFLCVRRVFVCVSLVPSDEDTLKQHILWLDVFLHLSVCLLEKEESHRDRKNPIDRFIALVPSDEYSLKQPILMVGLFLHSSACLLAKEESHRDQKNSIDRFIGSKELARPKPRIPLFADIYQLPNNNPFNFSTLSFSCGSIIFLLHI